MCFNGSQVKAGLRVAIERTNDAAQDARPDRFNR